MAGYFLPDVPTMLNLPTFPRLRRSKRVSPTTPTFLSEPDMPPPTNPVVYSPVPTWFWLQSLQKETRDNTAYHENIERSHADRNVRAERYCN